MSVKENIHCTFYVILQEISQKLLEAVALIAGSSLEQTTWLRRNLAVKPGPQTERLEIEEEDDTVDDLDGECFTCNLNNNIIFSSIIANQKLYVCE